MAEEGLTATDDRIRWGMGDAVLGTVVMLVFANIAVGVAYAVAGWDVDTDIPLWASALLQVPLWAGLLGIPFLVSRTKGLGSLSRDFGLRMRWGDVGLGLGVGFVTQIVLAIAVTLVYDALGVDSDEAGRAARELTDRADDPLGVVLLVLIVAVGAPIFEELFYRGLWLRSIERRWGTVAGVVLSSAVFALMHFQPYDFPALFGFAVVVALLTVRTGRLGPAIWAHVVFNMTAVLNLLLG